MALTNEQKSRTAHQNWKQAEAAAVEKINLIEKEMKRKAHIGIIYHPVITGKQVRWKNHSTPTQQSHVCWRNINTFDCNCMFGTV